MTTLAPAPILRSCPFPEAIDLVADRLHQTARTATHLIEKAKEIKAIPRGTGVDPYLQFDFLAAYFGLASAETLPPIGNVVFKVLRSFVGVRPLNEPVRFMDEWFVSAADAILNLHDWADLLRYRDRDLEVTTKVFREIVKSSAFKGLDSKHSPHFEFDSETLRHLFASAFHLLEYEFDPDREFHALRVEHRIKQGIWEWCRDDDPCYPRFSGIKIRRLASDVTKEMNVEAIAKLQAILESEVMLAFDTDDGQPIPPIKVEAPSTLPVAQKRRRSTWPPGSVVRRPSDWDDGGCTNA